MIKKDFIFVVLVYRNYSDLLNLCNSLKESVIGTYKIIVVDAFYDEKTSYKIENISMELNCHYIRTENKGYGYGNNQGISYANRYFTYTWLIVCNPDTVLNSKLSLNMLKKYKGIIAPDIITKTGKHQNPYWAYENLFSEKFIYKGYKNNNKLWIYIGVGINKILKMFFRFVHYITDGYINKIYACHGSFLIFNNLVFKKKKCQYDENMFLFYEEAFLAYRLKKIGVKTEFAKEITVFHQEDGSMNIANVQEYPYLKDSFIYYFDRYRNV